MSKNEKLNALYEKFSVLKQYTMIACWTVSRCFLKFISDEIVGVDDVV